MTRRLPGWMFLAFGVLCVAAELVEAQVLPGPATRIARGRGVRPGQIEPRLFIVDDTPGCRDSRHIQDAIDACRNGDVIVVRPGSYQDFVIDGKSVHVFGASETQVGGLAQVENLQPDQPVVLRGLRVTAIRDCEGPVLVEDCSSPGPEDLQISNSSAVGLIRTSSSGWSTTSAALTVTNGSTVFAYHASVRGTGASGWCVFECWEDFCESCQDGGIGGTALSVSNGGQALLFASFLTGEVGDDFYNECCSASGGPAGPALTVSVDSECTVMDSTLGSSVMGSVTQLSGEVGEYSIASPAFSGVPTTLSFAGPPGWNAFLTYSFELAPTFVPDRKGFSIVDPESPVVFIGAFPASGTLQVSIPFHLPVGDEAAVVYTQAKLYDPHNGTAYLGAPSAVVVIQPQCIEW